jgi:hypothetical protein
MADDRARRHPATFGEIYVAGLSTGAAWMRHVSQEAALYVAGVQGTVTAGMRGEKSCTETAADLWDGYEAYLRRLIQLSPIYALRFFRELHDTRWMESARAGPGRQAGGGPTRSASA